MWEGLPILLPATALGFALWARRTPPRRRTRWRACLAVAAAAWCGAMLLVVGVQEWQPELWGRPVDVHAIRPWSLTPLRPLWRALQGHDITAGMWEQMGGNLLLLAPLGVLLPLLTGRRPRLIQVALLAAAASAGLELLQLAGRFGIADIDDVLLNTTGAMLAYGALRLVEISWRSSGPWRPSRRRTP